MIKGVTAVWVSVGQSIETVTVISYLFKTKMLVGQSIETVTVLSYLFKTKMLSLVPALSIPINLGKATEIKLFVSGYKVTFPLTFMSGHC